MCVVQEKGLQYFCCLFKALGVRALDFTDFRTTWEFLREGKNLKCKLPKTDIYFGKSFACNKKATPKFSLRRIKR